MTPVIIPHIIIPENLVSISPTPGLSAIVNVEDYDYKAGTSGNTADSGTHSKLTIKATF